MMNDETKWTLLVGAATVLASIAARQVLRKGWRLTGRTPPPDDPELRRTGMTEALTWTGLTAGVVGLARLGARRLTAGTWKRMGRGSPPT